MELVDFLRARGAIQVTVGPVSAVFTDAPSAAQMNAQLDAQEGVRIQGAPLTDDEAKLAAHIEKRFGIAAEDLFG
jgi:hypothetical protein